MLKQISPDHFNLSKSPSSAITYSIPFVVLCSSIAYLSTSIGFMYILLFEYFNLITLSEFNEISKSLFLEYLDLGRAKISLKQWYVSLDKDSQLMYLGSVISSQVIAIFFRYTQGFGLSTKRQAWVNAKYQVRNT